MKNLKKILIALSILALLVSAAVIVISAEDGSVNDLRTLYTRIENYSDGKGKSEQLTRAYAYLEEKPIPDDAEGFAELLAEMQLKSVEIAGMLYKAVTSDPIASLDNVNAVYKHFEKCPPAEDTEGYQEMLDTLMADNAACIEAAYAIAANDSTTAHNSRVYLKKIFAQLEYKPLDEVLYAETIEKCQAKAFDAAKTLYNEYNANVVDDPAADTDMKYLARYNAACQLKAFLAEVVLPGSDEAKSFAQNAKAIYNSAINEKQKRLEALDSVADFGSYDLTEYRQVINLDEGKAFSAINPNATSYGEVRTDEETGNKYFALHYGSEGTHLYVEPQNKTDELGLVHNVDMLFSDDFYSCGFQSRQPSYVVHSMFTFSGDRQGNIRLAFNNGTAAANIDVSKLVTPNVWFTLSLTFDYYERTGSLYVNYVKVGEIKFHADATFTGYRIGVNTVNQEILLDNYDVYQGTDVRIWDKFEKMTDEQKFMFYVDYFTNDSYNPTNRNSAYLKARELISIIPDSETIQSYKDRFTSCNYEDDIKKPAMELNLQTIKTMVAALPAIDNVTSATRAAVATQLDEIDEFIAKNNELINRADNSEDGYLAQVAILDSLRVAIQRVIDVEEFITAVSKFKRATSYASMSKHAAVAESIWNKAGYAIDAEGNVNDNINFVAADPVVADFEKEQLNEKDVLPEDPAYKTVFEYYQEFAATIAERVKYENSKRIIDCISFITNMEGYEATEEFWSANIDFISKYITIVRDLIYSRNVVVANNFDINYAGVSYALETFYKIDAYCYKALQQEHIDVIATQLAKFVSTNSYIEKTGICTYLKAYIAENELAVYLDEEENFIYNTALVDSVYEAVEAEIADLEDLIYIYTLYNGELEAQMADYEAVLSANTKYFIDTVKVLTSVVSYEDKREILDTAAIYYYSMNVDSEEAINAVEIYNQILDEVEADEYVASQFAITVKTLAALDEAEKELRYALLVSAAYLYDTVNEEIVAVFAEVEADFYEQEAEDYIAIFLEELNNYNEYVQKVNSDVENVNGITCAVRANSALYTALSVIANIVGVN